jgi:uncharacterized protein (DUF2235 family)
VSFGHGLNAHFIYLFNTVLRDTVSSIGILRGRSLPETTTGMKHVCAFRHALALDERRVKFLPEYANGGKGPGEGDSVKEVWFSGSHSDMYVSLFIWGSTLLTSCYQWRWQYRKCATQSIWAGPQMDGI